MTHVVTLAGRRAGTLTVRQTVAITPTTNAASDDPVIARQAAIENALSMALHFARQGIDSPANVWATTARARRAVQLLTQTSADLQSTTARG